MSKKIQTLCIYYVIFYVVWAVCELVIRGAIISFAPEDGALFPILFDWILKNLVWTVPAWILMGKFDENLYIKRKELFTNKVEPLKAVGIFAFVIFLASVNSIARNKGIVIAEDFNPAELLTYVFVGVSEEFVFRGLLLNATYQEDKPYLTIGINAVLFLLIHFPIWIYGGIFASVFTGFGFITILVLSVIFSWSFLECKNIWIPIGIHMLYDMLVTILA